MISFEFASAIDLADQDITRPASLWQVDADLSNFALAGRAP